MSLITATSVPEKGQRSEVRMINPKSQAPNLRVSGVPPEADQVSGVRDQRSEVRDQRSEGR